MNSPQCDNQDNDNEQNCQPKVNSKRKYYERLTVPLWYLPIAGIVVAIFTQNIFFSSHNNPYSYWAAVPLSLFAIWILALMSQTRITINSENIISMGEHHLPASDISRAMIVTKEMKNAALGRQLDPSALMIHRGWITTMVILVIDNPANDNPYWIISTKHPEKLLAALPSHITIME